MRAPPGRALSQNDWSETTRKLIPSPENPRLQATVLLVSLTLLLSTQVPFPIKSLALSAHVSPQTIHFRVLDKSPLSGPEGVPLPATGPWDFLGKSVAGRGTPTRARNSALA